jgi:hypothetical protein
MFGRMVKRDGDTVVLFPFQRLQHSFIIAGYGYKFDPEKELASNDNLRKILLRYIEKVKANVDQSNKSALMKADHYVEALHAQLRACNETERTIRILSSPTGKAPK